MKQQLHNDNRVKIQQTDKKKKKKHRTTNVWYSIDCSGCYLITAFCSPYHLAILHLIVTMFSTKK
jgi:hypothetical protein